MDRYGVAGPSLKSLRTLRPHDTAHVPVYHNLVAHLCGVAQRHYDATAAHVCAVLSCWAYADADVVATMMVRMGLERNLTRYVALINDAMLVSSKAYYVQSRCGRVGFLVYRGTEPFNLLSWATDANVSPIAIPVPGPGERPGHPLRLARGESGGGREKNGRQPLVHNGFYINQRATWFDVESTLVEALQGRSVVANVERRSVVADPASAEETIVAPTNALEALFVTGHSLGGAMAAIAAFRLAHDHDNPMARSIVDKIRGVYTFGQPMIGNDVWARSLDGNPQYALLTRGLFRHVYNDDPVPSLPPVEAGTFTHTGVEYRTPVDLPVQPYWVSQPPESRARP
ncbi:MAG TPA: lipase family protein [Polyangiaceae bacterium]|nr:lipase family protein [Polyangiaceae bacterium]